MTSITKNIFYLILVQAVIYLAPLITLPYLTRTLNVNNYAALGFTQSVIQYFILITDYGFGITATRLIAINSSDNKNISSVIANTIAIKLLLAGASGIFLLILIAFFYDIRQNTALIFACFIGVIGNALFPTWLFQGLERMRSLALITGASRILPLPLFFIFVKNADDVVTAAVLQNIPGIIAAVLSFYYLSSKNIFTKTQVNISSIKLLLKEGWPVFLSNISTSFYTTINIILLKIFAGADQVAYFAATDKIRIAAQGFIQPIAAALFPRIAALSQAADKAEESKSVIKKGAILLISLEFFCGLVMYFFAETIAERYLGKAFLPAAFYLKSLAFLPVIIAVATILSQWRFLALGESKVLSKIYLIAGPLHAVYATFLTYQYQSNGLISSLYITEISITVAMIVVARKKNISLM
ncbi:flippase [Undibacterium sp. RTI2.1]|uniref:flippase n=1 Tax=unclassified Undibacterium TaxID=2630295 RepID=UPI002AB415CF|nr:MULTISPECIES: flippase [unclassified Undibacterium]MDY7540425.1 flippase [Undibacterium sp. 5I1]MEB0032624.1 flippase [Undibacterium sp. RTI2.1]MEB0118485.1 flippase [Undibacterium sp. RTI2.2]MEB0230115.1 flippase [Undibacterium sp. 10I3]MEB0257683.1 flippase [Undibacterium sp. 5I1]